MLFFLGIQESIAQQPSDSSYVSTGNVDPKGKNVGSLKLTTVFSHIFTNRTALESNETTNMKSEMKTDDQVNNQDGTIVYIVIGFVVFILLILAIGFKCIFLKKNSKK